MITPRVVGDVGGRWNTEAQSEVEEVERRLQQRATGIDESLNQTFIEFDPVRGTDSIAESN